MTPIEYVASLTVTEFRAFKKALAVLRRAHVDTDTAITILINAANREWPKRMRA